MKRKNIFIIVVSLATIFLSWYLIQNKRVLITPDSSTTTSHSEQIFSPLLNTHALKESKLSFKYPDEMQMGDGGDRGGSGCVHEQLSQKNRVVGFLIIFTDPSCPSYFINENAESLDDYKKDYVLKKEGGEVRVHIFETTAITTTSGLQGIKQEYTTTWFDEKTGIDEEIKRNLFSVRYIFQGPAKEFYIIESQNHNSLYIKQEEVEQFLNLEKKIIESVEIN